MWSDGSFLFCHKIQRVFLEITYHIIDAELEVLLGQEDVDRILDFEICQKGVRK